MRWRGNRKSDNIEDRRGMRMASIGGSGMNLFRLLPVLFRFLGFKGTAIVAAGFFSYGLMTGNLSSILGLTAPGQSSAVVSKSPIQQSEVEKTLVDFVSVVLADTEDTWSQLFSQMGKRYQEPKLVLFRQSVNSACGMAQSAMGPFYCPGDRKVYIDLSFYQQLKEQLQAPGDFAQAYVLAHEVGHHVQTLLGISDKVHQARSRLSKIEANKLSVRQELQADCFAGIWGHYANKSRHLLETGDIEEAMNAASKIGDDALQRRATGRVRPDAFTHGTSQQRVKWFKTGLTTGDIKQCNTFKR